MRYAIPTVLLLCSQFAAVLPAQDKGQERDEKAKPDARDEQRQQLCLLQALQHRIEQLVPPPEEWFIPRAVRVRGTLVKTPDAGTRHPRTGLPQRYFWHLAARLDSGQLVQPLQITDEKLREIADEFAGKEVVLTGSTAIARRLGRRYESAAEFIPYLAVKVESLELAEPPAPEKGGEPKPGALEPTLFNVEVRGVLRVSDKLRKIKELETPPNVNSTASAIDKTSIATGATIATRQMGIVEVYFGGNEPLQEKAAGLSGKTVTVVGSPERVTFFSKQDTERVTLRAWAESEFTVERPALITKTYIRATRLESTDPAPPAGPTHRPVPPASSTATAH